MKEGYKETPVGMIPEDWDVMTLDDIGEFKNGINKSKEDFGKGYPFINLMDVFGRSVVVPINLQLVNANDNELIEYNLLKGDILFVRSSVKPSGVGLTALVKETLPNTVFSGFLIRFRDNNKLDVGFKRYCFYENGFRKRLLDKSTVSANTNINQVALKSLYCIIPPFKEQSKIASILSTVDDKIDSINERIEETRKLKQGLMQQLLTRGIGHTRFKDSPLGEIPESWDAYKLDDCLEKVVGGGTPSRKTESYWNGNIPWATVKDLKGSILHETEEFITEYGLKSSASNLIPKFTIIISTRMAVGKAVLFTTDVAINQDLKAIFTKSLLHKNFLFHWFSMNANRINELGTGSTVKGIRLEILRDLDIAIPKLLEQCKIASILSTVDNKLEVLREKKDDYEQLKKGLMQQLLTGKIRVKFSRQL